MEGNAAALQVIRNSIEALGRGFDVNHDTRLLYCKGVAGARRLVELDDGELSSRDLVLSDDLTAPGVPKDVDCSSESGIGGPEIVGPCSFHEFVRECRWLGISTEKLSLQGAYLLEALILHIASVDPGNLMPWLPKVLGWRRRLFLYIRSNLYGSLYCW